MLAISAALSEKMTNPPDLIILLNLTIDALLATLATINAQTNPQTLTANQLASMSPPLTLPYTTLSTPSLMVLLVEDPPPLPR